MVDNNLVKKFERRQKRRKRASIMGAISAIGVTLLIIISFCMMTVDRFTITTHNELDLSLSVDENRETLVTELTAPPLLEANDIQYSDIPENIDEGLGSKNTDYYFAYSFYLLGKGSEESINYSLTMTLEAYSNDLENAIRIMIIKDGIRSIYAKGPVKPIYYGTPGAKKPDGTIEGLYTIPFNENKHIILTPYEIKSGDYSKYTVVMWIDGWESVNSMKNGDVLANIEFSGISKND